MKRIAEILVLFSLIIACESNELDPDRFKTGIFEIPEGKGYSKTTIIRKDSIQIEKYEDKIDTLSIVWESNFNYTLKMLHPKTAIDVEPIHVKITNFKKDSYDFEAVIGHSNFVQKGTLIKNSDQ